MSDPRCNHVKDIVPWPAGSWTNETVVLPDRQLVRVVCKFCGKFFGYRDTNGARSARTSAR